MQEKVNELTLDDLTVDDLTVDDLTSDDLTWSRFSVSHSPFGTRFAFTLSDLKFKVSGHLRLI